MVLEQYFPIDLKIIFTVLVMKNNNNNNNKKSELQ